MKIKGLEIDKSKLDNSWQLKAEYTDYQGNKWIKGKLVQTFDGREVNPPKSWKELEVMGAFEPVENEETVSRQEYEALRAQLKLVTEAIQNQESKSNGQTIDLKGLAEEIAKSTAKVEGKRTYTKHIDKDDWLDVPVVFSAPGIGYWIFDDKRNGEDVQIPVGDKLQFKFAAGYVNKVGRVEEYISYCTAVVHSKKLVKWLREHSMYGKKFFEKIDLAEKSNNYTAIEAGKIHKKVMNLSQSQLMKQCKVYGIPLGQEPQELQNLLYNAMYREMLGKKDQLGTPVREKQWDDKDE